MMAARRPSDIFTSSNHRRNHTFSSWYTDPGTLFPQRYNQSYNYRKSSLPTYTGLSVEWRSRKPSVPAKYRGSLYNTGFDRNTSYSGIQLHPYVQDRPTADTTQDDELIVYDTEVIYLNQDGGKTRRTDAECSVTNISPEPLLEPTLDNAFQLYHSFKLEEAESMFLKLHRHHEEVTKDGNQTIIQILHGLADISLKQSRLSRGNPMESQWLQAHAVALLQYTLDLCQQELRNEVDNQLISWYYNQQEILLKKLKPAEDNFVKSMYSYLQSDRASLQRHMFFSLSAPTTPTGDFNFPLSSTPLQHVFPAVTFRNGSLEQLSSETDYFPGGLQWVLKFQDYCRDRLYNKDSAKIVEELFSLNKEITELLSKDFEDEDKVVDSEETKDDLVIHLSKTPETDPDETHSEVEDDLVIHLSKTPETGPDETHGEVEDDLVIHLSKTPETGPDETHSEVEDDLVIHLSKTPETGPDETHSEVEDDLVIHLSKTPETGPDETHSEVEDETHSEVEDEIPVSPLHPNTVKLTLAKLINKLAEKVVADGGDSGKGEALYEQSKVIIESIQDGTKGMLILYAHTAKKLGMIRIKMGQVNSGIQLLKTALKTFREVGDEASNGEIALALVEIGDSYTLKKWDEESIFDHVIDVIREAFDKESSEDGPFNQADQTSEETEYVNALTTDSVAEHFKQSIHEAILCYEEAIGILENLQPSGVINSTVYARAITKLGDSHFIQKEYTEALFCYEKAQTLFRSTSGRNSLIQHGHVLCMLGTTSFMLHLYPKAAMVFECAYRMLKHAFWGDNPYKLGLLLSLLGLATYKLQHYHKCIPWCFRAYDVYTELFEGSLTGLSSQKLWITCQTLYILGNSYNVLNLHERAIHYLTLARTIMKIANNTEKRQYMRVLQILGDCYFAQYDYKTALTFYNEALQDFEGESLQLIKAHQNIAELNQSSDDKGFHNQLLSRSADAHLHMNEYTDAIGFLTKVSNIQDILEDDINGDLVTTLHQLGNMHSMSGDVDQALQSYKDCIEIYQEVHGDLGPEMSIILGNLASMCYVKSCMCDESEELEMTLATEQNFQDAIALENNPNVLVKYSSFLYSQANYDDAVIYLEDALRYTSDSDEVNYCGLEKTMLPEVLQDEVDYQEEIYFTIRPLIHYHLLISHKALGEMKQAERHLLAMMKLVMKGDNPVLFSLVGYSLMNMGLFKDAAEFFAIAFHLKEDYHLATDNYCTCMGILVLKTLQNSVENIYYYTKKTNSFNSVMEA